METNVVQPVLQNKIYRLIRQISIEPPLHANYECVIQEKIPMPEIPISGARIKVVCAGVCFRRKRSSSSALSSVALPSRLSNFERNVSNLTEVTSNELSTEKKESIQPSTLHIPGVKDGALFAGYEIAGVIDRLGKEVTINKTGLKIGDHVIIYPYDEAPPSYAEFVTVPQLTYIVRIPDGLSFHVASMLPTGGLLGMTAANSAFEIIDAIADNSNPEAKFSVLIVGTGGLALWTYRLTQHRFNKSKLKDRISICIACLSPEGIKLAQEMENQKFIQWEESSALHNKTYEEKELVEQTKAICGGPVDVVINFGTVSRTLLRSLRCLHDGGTVLISEEFNSVLLPKFIELGKKSNINIFAVSYSGVDVLRNLVNLVASKEIKPPPYKVFEIEETRKVIQMLCQSQINGRAIIKFRDME